MKRPASTPDIIGTFTSRYSGPKQGQLDTLLHGFTGVPAGKGMKDVARAAAVRRWPAQAGLFSRACDDGRAEAALIAVAGLMRDAARKDAA